jgi:diguanylate cyclase (GGDEF)-like protein
MPADQIDSGLKNLLEDALIALKNEDNIGIIKFLNALPRLHGEAISEFQDIKPFAQLLNQAVKALDQAVSDPNPNPVLTGDLQGYPALSHLYTNLLNIRTFLLALVKGELSQVLHLKGYLAGALKALQANLRHLTWQTQMIAAGDFSQRVDFMGDFSEAFNAMVIQLHDNRQQLQEKQAALTRLNEDLRAEIELRKKTEVSLRQSEESYRQLAITDPLTGVFNRRYFFQRAHSEMQRACRYRHPLTVIIFDLDYFKLVNDNYGHTAGDLVLQAIANLVHTSIRAADIFARYGGEEFILLLPETGLEAGVDLAERLRRKIAATPVPHTPNHIDITVSAGVTTLAYSEQPVSPPPETLDQLINQADQALYEAKKAGRNRVQAFPAPTTLDISA